MAPYEHLSHFAYAESGKIKLYLELGLPIVTADESPLCRETARAGAGLLTTPDAPGVRTAVRTIQSQYPIFVDRVYAMRKRWEYVSHYDRTLGFLLA
jgi:hypothetical protein